jgi:hypothetical protein
MLYVDISTAKRGTEGKKIWPFLGIELICYFIHSLAGREVLD